MAPSESQLDYLAERGLYCVAAPYLLKLRLDPQQVVPASWEMDDEFELTSNGGSNYGGPDSDSTEEVDDAHMSPTRSLVDGHDPDIVINEDNVNEDAFNPVKDQAAAAIRGKERSNAERISSSGKAVSEQPAFRRLDGGDCRVGILDHGEDGEDEVHERLQEYVNDASL